jgi:hypothetical protein
MLTELIGRPVHGDEKNSWQFRFEPAEKTYNYVCFSFTATSEGHTESFRVFGTELSRAQFLTITNTIIAAAAKK